MSGCCGKVIAKSEIDYIVWQLLGVMVGWGKVLKHKWFKFQIFSCFLFCFGKCFIKGLAYCCAEWKDTK